MNLFFNSNASEFRAKWKTIREKGFPWFYFHSALRWFLFVFLLETLSLLVIHHSCAWNDILCIAGIGVLFGAVFPPIQWKGYERKYQTRVLRHERKSDFN